MTAPAPLTPSATAERISISRHGATVWATCPHCGETDWHPWPTYLDPHRPRPVLAWCSTGTKQHPYRLRLSDTMRAQLTAMQAVTE